MRAEAAGFCDSYGRALWAVRQCGRAYGLRRLRAAASEARVAGMGKGDFDIDPCLLGAIFRPAASSLGCGNFGKIGVNSIRLGFPRRMPRALWGMRPTIRGG